METATPTPTKTRYLQTNYNNKMACQCFAHVDVAPKDPVPESALKKTIIELRTADNSHPPIKVMVKDICRVPLNRLPLAVSWLSHAMDDFQLKCWFLGQRQGITAQTEMAIYFYERV